MNLLADESVDRPIVDRLRQDGHTVLSIADLDPSIDDNAVLRLADKNSAFFSVVSSGRIRIRRRTVDSDRA